MQRLSFQIGILLVIIAGCKSNPETQHQSIAAKTAEPVNNNSKTSELFSKAKVPGTDNYRNIKQNIS